MGEPVRHLATETARETNAPCRRCGTLTSDRLVLRDDAGTLRASLWLCPGCHQPQHRAADEPTVPDSGEAAAL